MGSVLTHYQITRQVAAQLAEARPGENYTYVFLGNWLTDLSQVRDPYACIHAKPTVLQSVRAAGPLGAVASTAAAAWMADLLGRATPASRRYGALTRFLALMARTATHAVFAADSPVRTGRWPELTLALGQLPEPLEPDEVDRVLGGALTQYYPHEHLDFPPYYDPAGEDTRNAPPLASRSPSTPGHLIAYLTEQRQYLVEELTQTEVAWLAASGLGTAAQRGDALRRLGHLLHAVEDYYFHSNFAELHQWQRVRRAPPPSPFTLPPGIPDAAHRLPRRRCCSMTWTAARTPRRTSRCAAASHVGSATQRSPGTAPAPPARRRTGTGRRRSPPGTRPASCSPGASAARTSSTLWPAAWRSPGCSCTGRSTPTSCWSDW